MDATACYMPNNPSHFGLELLPPGTGGWPPSPSSSSPAPPPGDDVCTAPTVFPLPTLELDTALFPFSPQSGAYKCEFSSSKDKCFGSSTGTNILGSDGAFLSNPLVGGPGHDMADVLLSLKHAVVHPGQLSPGGFAAAAAAVGYPATCQYQGPSASLSYTVHPHQMLSPGSGSYSGYSNCGPNDISPSTGGSFGCPGSTMGMGGGGGPSNCSGGVGISTQNSMQGQTTSFPSMSVNVSMNMTMHGYPAPIANANLQEQISCPQWDVVQMQWTPQSSQSPVYASSQSQSLLSPQTASYGGATYSFTADFRPPMAPSHSSSATSSSNIPTSATTSTLPSLGLPIEGCIATSPTSVSHSSFHKSVKQGPSTPMLYHSPPCARTTPSSGVAISLGSGNAVKRGHFNKSSLSLAGGCSSVIQSTSPHMQHLQGEECSRPNLCRICGKTYARPSTLKTHLRTHSGEKPYRCADCHKSFSQAANLTAHVRTHSGEKPFRCPICDRRFSQSSSVTTHMRTHSGERPYRCRLCKKAFSDSSTLTKHLRIHSGEKPYQCKLCLLRFSQSGNLNRHMRVHGATSGVPTLPV